MTDELQDDVECTRCGHLGFYHDGLLGCSHPDCSCGRRSLPPTTPAPDASEAGQKKQCVCGNYHDDTQHCEKWAEEVDALLVQYKELRAERDNLRRQVAEYEKYVPFLHAHGMLK